MGNTAFRHVRAGDMHNDGVMGGAAFDLEDALDGWRVQGVGGQAVHGLGRQRDHLAGAQQFRRARNGGLE